MIAFLLSLTTSYPMGPAFTQVSLVFFDSAPLGNFTYLNTAGTVTGFQNIFGSRPYTQSNQTQFNFVK